MKPRARLFVVVAGAIAAVVVMLVLLAPLPPAPQVAQKSPAAMAQASDPRSDAADASVAPAMPTEAEGGENARTTLEFSGVMRFSDATRFMLTDRRARKSSAPLMLGDFFHGHLLSRFDAATEVLTVERDGNVFHLPLKTAQVKRGTAPPPPANRIEFRIAIAADGKLSTDGRALTLEAFHLMLQDYSRSGITLVVVVQQPPNVDAKIQEINQLISDAVGASGPRKSTIRIVPARR